MTQARASVLIISNDHEVSRLIVSRCHSDGIQPAFFLMAGAPCPDLNRENFDVAIVSLTADFLSPVMMGLKNCGKPVIIICGANDYAGLKNSKAAGMTLVREDDNWQEIALLAISGASRTVQIATTLQHLEQTCAALTRDATLGRYILEMRHGLNNALTSVLGNSELLLLDPDALAPMAPKFRAQIDTIHNMALRIHEIMQRFSSLEKELNVLQEQATNEIRDKALAASGAS